MRSAADGDLTLELDAQVRQVDGALEIEASTIAPHRELGIDPDSPLGMISPRTELSIEAYLITNWTSPSHAHGVARSRDLALDPAGQTPPAPRPSTRRAIASRLLQRGWVCAIPNTPALQITALGAALPARRIRDQPARRQPVALTNAARRLRWNRTPRTASVREFDLSRWADMDLLRGTYPAKGPGPATMPDMLAGTRSARYLKRGKSSCPAGIGLAGQENRMSE